MIKYFLVTILLFSVIEATDNWENHWHQGLNYLHEHQFQVASEKFDQALSFMFRSRAKNFSFCFGV